LRFDVLKITEKGFFFLNGPGSMLEHSGYQYEWMSPELGCSTWEIT